MKLIKPKVELIQQDFTDVSCGIYKMIEIAGRTCYKSEDKITDDSSIKFYDKLKKIGHTSVFEHGTIYMITNDADCAQVFIDNPYSHVNEIDYIFYITTNCRVIDDNYSGQLIYWVNQYACEPTDKHERRVTVRFTCNRQVSHEFVRHRVFSFSQESTRYCNYTKDKFGSELTFIEPCWSEEREDLNAWYDVPKDFTLFYNHLLDIEDDYRCLIRLGWSPQQAANILPNALKTELVMTGFLTDWRTFLELRDSEKAHPQARELASQLKQLLIDNKLY